MAEPMEEAEDHETILKTAIDRIVSHDGGQEDEELNDAVKQLQTSAKEVGIERDDIVVLVRSICKNYEKLGLEKCSLIISALIPRESVPDFAFVRAISWACTETAPGYLVVKLFKWMVEVVEYANTKAKVHSTYFVLFHLLKQTPSLRPHVYKLLCALTEKDDVTADRVNILIEMRQLPDAEQCASSLLALFKSYKPEFVTVKVPAKRVRPRKVATNMWTKFVARAPALRASVNFWDANDVFPDTVKNSRFENDFPGISSDSEMLAISDVPSENTNTTSLQDVDTFDGFLKNIDTLKLHPSASRVLRYPILHHMVSYQKDSAALTKLGLRLHGALVSEQLCKQLPGRETDVATKLLQSTTQLVEYLKEGDPIVNTVIGKYMKCHWNGLDYAKHLLKLVTHAPMFYGKLKVCQGLLEPLRKVFICSQVEYQAAMLMSITELLSNLVHTEWMLLQKVGADLDRYWADMRYHDQMVNQMSKHRLNPVDPDDDTVTLRLDSIIELVQFTDKLCIFAMSSSDCNLIVCHAVLNFYETAVKLNLSWQIPLLIVAPATVTHLLLFCSDATSLSRMCQLFVSYKAVIANIDEVHLHCPRPWTRDSLNALPDINVLVMEAVDGLWRGRAFQKRGPSASGESSVHQFPEDQFEELQLDKLGESFTVTRHHALVAHWYQFLQNRNESEEFSKPINLLKLQNRDLVNDYMTYLTVCGFSGIANFLSTYVKMKI